MINLFDGDYLLDSQRYGLCHATRLVKMEPQVFNVLRYLIQHRERVVSKKELLEQLWPGRVVSEATLTSRIKAARQAVGDGGRQQRVIQTLHGRGYRFVAAVVEPETPTSGTGTPAESGFTSAPTAHDARLSSLRRGAWRTLMRGWALSAQGQCREGVVLLRQGLAAYRATGGSVLYT